MELTQAELDSIFAPILERRMAELREQNAELRGLLASSEAQLARERADIEHSKKHHPGRWDNGWARDWAGEISGNGMCIGCKEVRVAETVYLCDACQKIKDNMGGKLY